jgi:hypothetical protein
MFSETAAPTLTRKPLTAVGFNPNRGERGTIVLYGARAFTAAEQASLRESFQGEPDLDLQIAKPPVVDISAAVPAAPAALAADIYRCGASISPGNTREAGTLGALVRDGGGRLYGLTCNHVSGGCSVARPRAPIVAPGIKDVGPGAPDPRTLGHHDRSLRFVTGDPSVVSPKKNRDAAIFALAAPERVSSWQGEHYDTPGSTSDPTEDAIVEKVGRSTNHTRGVIESQLVGPFPVRYQTLVHHSAEESDDFRGTVYFEPVYLIRGTGGVFSAPGDSGALVTQLAEGDQRSAVGLVFSGNTSLGESYMLPIRPVLEELEMTLATSHNPHQP